MAAGKRNSSEQRLELDDPRLTARRGETLARKKFLRRVYADWYRLINHYAGGINGIKVELGSGPGFLQEEMSGIIKSDILLVPRIQIVLDGAACPFADGSLAALVMVDVLHHMPRAESFFHEAARVLAGEGLVVMIEPWMTGWSRRVYTRLHHERTDTTAPDWHFESSGPLSDANQALPWMIFERDRKIFKRKFPDLEIVEIRPMMPLRYLLSGGFSLRFGAPGWAYNLVSGLERLIEKAGGRAAMFALIVLRRAK
jgi:SAM-dependent methyltransferase